MRGKHFIFAILASIQLFAQHVPGRYIVELDGPLAAAQTSRQAHPARFDDPEFRARTEAIQRRQAVVQASLEAEGAEVITSTHVVTNTLTVRMADDRIHRLASMPGVYRVHAVDLYKPTLDHALPLIRVPDALAQIGGTSNAGVGIRIGIVDTGIDVNHPGFQDPSLPVPQGFPRANKDSDLAYTNTKIIVARSYHTGSSFTDTSIPSDDVGHGTGVAMIAAGVGNTGLFGSITGVAPKAYLGNYKVFPDPNSGAPTDLILKAIDDAVADGMDVINLSLGLFPATRPSQDILVSAIENAVAAGVLVTVAAGNDGSDPNTISSPATAPDAISVGSTPNDRVFAGSVSLGGNLPFVALPGDGPNSPVPVTGPLADVAQLDPTGLACAGLPASSLSGTVALVLRGICTFEQKLNTVQQAGAIAAVIYTDAARPEPINMAVGQASLPASMVSYADGVALKQQLSSGSLTATLDFTLRPMAVSPYRLSSFSSRGPNTDNGIKPDLVAPGSSISTAKPISSGTSSGGYAVVSGTSFSTPMVAGAAAILKAARPGLSAQQYRSLLINSASTVVTDSGTQLPVEQEGAGLLNVFSAMNETVAANPVAIAFGIGSGSTSAISRTVTITNVGTAADTFRILVQPYAASGPVPRISVDSVQLDPGQSQDVAVQLETANFNAGADQGVLTIQGDHGLVAASVPYWYGAPSQTPRYLTILRAPATASAGSRQTIIFRATDAEGIPVNASPAVTFTSGGGTVLSIASADAQFPGAYSAIVRLGSGQNVIHIEVNGFSGDVTITGN